MDTEDMEELVRLSNEVAESAKSTSRGVLKAVDGAIDTLLTFFTTDLDFDKGARAFAESLKEVLKIND